MSMAYVHKPLHNRSAIDKENNSIAANLSNEKKFSMPRKYIKTNEMLLRPASMQDNVQEPPNCYGNNFYNPASKYIKNEGLCKKLEDYKLKRMSTFGRKLSNNTFAESNLASKTSYSFLEKENKNLSLGQEERYFTQEEVKADIGENKILNLIEQRNSPERQQKPKDLAPPAKRDEEKIEVNQESDQDKQKPENDTFPPPNFKEQCNKTIEEYAPLIIDTLKNKDKDSTPAYCLKKHNISPNLRAKMIDWMVEVLASYKCSDQTFFIAVNIMDLYLEKTEMVHEVSDLHLLGVTCMFIASKYEEIYPLRLSVVHEKIAHRKLTPEQIKEKEMDVLLTLDYKLTNVTPYEFLMNIIFQLNLNNMMTTKLYDYFQKVCAYLGKTAVYDYDLVNQQDYSELAASILYVSFRVIEQLDRTFSVNQTVEKLKEMLKVDEDVIFDCSNRILSLTKNFEKLYPSLKNLKKFHSFNFEGSSMLRQNHSQ